MRSQALAQSFSEVTFIVPCEGKTQLIASGEVKIQLSEARGKASNEASGFASGGAQWRALSEAND